MLEFKVRVAPSLSLWLWQHLSIAHNSLQDHEYHLSFSTQQNNPPLYLFQSVAAATPY